MVRVGNAVVGTAILYIAVCGVAYWLVSEPDPVRRKQQMYHAKMTYYQNMARAFGEAALAAELKYQETIRA